MPLSSYDIGDHPNAVSPSRERTWVETLIPYLAYCIMSIAQCCFTFLSLFIVRCPFLVSRPLSYTVFDFVFGAGRVFYPDYRPHERPQGSGIPPKWALRGLNLAGDRRYLGLVDPNSHARPCHQSGLLHISVLT